MLPSSLTTKDVAALLGVTVRRVQALITTGRLPATKLGRDWYILASDLPRVLHRPTGRPRGQSPTR